MVGGSTQPRSGGERPKGDPEGARRVAPSNPSGRAINQQFSGVFFSCCAIQVALGLSLAGGWGAASQAFRYFFPFPG
jgi:hypothetical protein